MSKKDNLRLFTMLAMTGMLNGSNDFDDRNRSQTSSKEEIAKANGLKEFKIGGKSYWAINIKNAIRKFNKDKSGNR